jgi:chaperonin GroES
VGKAKKTKAVKFKTKVKTKVQPKAKTKVKIKLKTKTKVKTKKTKVVVKAKKAVLKKNKPVNNKTKATVKKTSIKSSKSKVIVSKPKAAVKPVKINIDYSKAITPLGDRLVVRLIQAERITAGGLILPDSVNSAAGYLKAEVLAVGKGELSKKGNLKVLDVQIGQTILFSEYASTKVNFHDEDLHIVHEKDVLGIVD